MKKQRLKIVVTVVLGLTIAILFWLSSHFAEAWFYHRSQGNKVSLGEIHLDLPWPWMDVSEDGSRIRLERARLPYQETSSIEIEPTGNYPVAKSDAEALARAGAYTISNPYAVATVRKVAAQNRIFYCERTEFGVGGPDSELCRAANFGYVISYIGRTGIDEEAHHIISSIFIK